MDGLVMEKLATVLSQESRLRFLVSSICAARYSSHKHKKRVGVALTRLTTLRHNAPVREMRALRKSSRTADDV